MRTAPHRTAPHRTALWCIVGLWVNTACEPPPKSVIPVEPLQNPSLDPTLRFQPSVIDLGQVTPNDSVIRRVIRVENTRDERISLTKLTSSCSCLTIDPKSCDWSPHGAVEFTLTLNPALEGDFRGSLGILVEGEDVSGGTVRILKVDLKMIDANASE